VQVKATWTAKAAPVLAATCAAVLLLCAGASADAGPHVMGQGPTTDSCAMCHRAHTGQAPYLLKQSQEQLCYTCHGTHGTGSNLDVEDGVGYSGAGRGGTPGALRGGGFKYALIDSGNPSGNFSEEGDIPVLGALAPVTSSHSINESSQTPWGNGAIDETPLGSTPTSAEEAAAYGAKINLTCGSCHDPHGNGMYRILKPIPTESGAAEPGVEIPETAEMKEDKHTKNHVYTTQNYWEVEDANDRIFIQKISEWCSTCHTRLLAGGNSYKISSKDAVYAFRHMSDGGSQSSPTCIQCHVAHGTDATMGPYSSAVRNPDESSAGSASFLLRIDNRGICEMCHNK
jgi:predicted CXXCH cytochrome family protein